VNGRAILLWQETRVICTCMHCMPSPVSPKENYAAIHTHVSPSLGHARVVSLHLTERRSFAFIQRALASEHGHPNWKGMAYASIILLETGSSCCDDMKWIMVPIPLRTTTVPLQKVVASREHKAFYVSHWCKFGDMSYIPSFKKGSLCAQMRIFCPKIVVHRLQNKLDRHTSSRWSSIPCAIC